ncbi:hypothetical protein ROLI_045630 (plasmid) [Roseobacter fucihabitans]|uniref:Transposase n=1 Tax=Roseobacter fucihabitans TaxID=1537242 RepID=A0ABZ2C1S7_9RHOB|nr:hypothetical protein [Roseobacter litoralis]MBC6967875.1 hypothetical protein [Roseobacter litoralis]
MDQGYAERGDITVISDGEECLKQLAAMLPQPATHILNWVYISMKLQPLVQMALTAPEGHGLFEQDIDRIKWRLLNGQPKRALDLATAVRSKFFSEIGHCFWARRANKLLQKLTTYIGRNSDSVINYAERHRAGHRTASDKRANTKYGPVPLSYRSRCSFKPPSVRKRLGFSNPVLNGGGADYRTRLCIRVRATLKCDSF